MAIKIPNRVDFEEETPESAGSLSKHKTQTGFITALIITVSIAGAAFYWYNQSSLPQTAAASSITTSSFYDLEELTINLASSSAGSSNYLKIAITLNLSQPQDTELLKARLPIIRDTIVVFLKEVRLADLTGSGGTIMIKTELLKRINKILSPVIVKEILFRNFIVT